MCGCQKPGLLLHCEWKHGTRGLDVIPFVEKTSSTVIVMTVAFSEYIYIYIYKLHCISSSVCTALCKEIFCEMHGAEKRRIKEKMTDYLSSPRGEGWYQADGWMRKQMYVHCWKWLMRSDNRWMRPRDRPQLTLRWVKGWSREISLAIRQPFWLLP